MVQRIAARAPLVGTGAALLALLVASQIRHDPPRPSSTWQPPAAELHVKMRPGVTPEFPATPLFHHLPPGTTDGRERWYAVPVDPARFADADLVLTFHPDVEEVVEPFDVSLPNAADDGDSCPITTPPYDHHQEYVGPAPAGIDAPSVWARGTRGQGVWFADIEGGWNTSHEDLPGERIQLVGGRSRRDPSWRAHGTAVLGEVVGRDNGKGMIGIAPDVERVLTSSIDGQNVADAIDAAAEKLRPGDVLLIELQGTGPRGRYLPVEYWDDVYTAIRAATDRGVVVIEAAGNGAENLDHAIYKRKFDRTKRDSGAILVGAGGPPRDGFVDRARLDFSNYGARVDVQGWGRKVATLDYGDLQSCDDSRDRHYTGEFSGTSSASPIVAGAAVLVESDVKQRGAPMPPRELRALLRATGTPQTGDTREQIGPRPDLARAIQSTNSPLIYE